MSLAKGSLACKDLIIGKRDIRLMRKRIVNTKKQIVEERAENFVYIPVIQQEPSSFEEIVELLS